MKSTNLKKYLVLPGYVTSKEDGDRHFINGNALIRLYGVPPHECVIAADFGHKLCENYTVLEPDPTGSYKLPYRKKTK